MSLRAALALALLCPASALAFVNNGGPATRECIAAWQVTTPELTANRGKAGIDCQDGDPACDVDGMRNGSCTLGVSACVFLTDVPGCTPVVVEELRLSKRAVALGVEPPPLPASTTACGPAALATLPLRTRRGRARASKPVRLRLTPITGERGRKDVDRLVLRCVPNAGAAQCPANAAGGPREVALAIAPEGTDLDNGWTGTSHNFPIPVGATLRLCLAGCDAGTNPECTEDQAATEQVNGVAFGSPIPLLAAGIPVCLVNRFGSPKLADGVANVQSGALRASMNLLSDVFLSNANQICPRCSGSDLGRTGTCDAGARQGQACRTDGVVTVAGAPGNARYTLSSDCRPLPPATGTLTISLPLTTGSSSLAGPRPCGAAEDDGCQAGTCAASCSGPACASMTGDGRCVDVKGGLSQLCCTSDTTRPCFPTAGGGEIVRTGSSAAPMPPWPDPSYPKQADATLVATFCEGATGTGAVDFVTGLPGPGALVVPVSGEWIQ